MKKFVVACALSCAWLLSFAQGAPLLTVPSKALDASDAKTLATIKADKAFRSVAVVNLDRASLLSNIVNVTLPDGSTLQFLRKEFAGAAWYGTTENNAASLSVTQYKDEIIGKIRAPGRAFVLSGFGKSSYHVLKEIDLSKPPMYEGDTNQTEVKK